MNTRVSGNGIWINDILVYTTDDNGDPTNVEVVSNDIDAIVNRVYLCDTTEDGFDVTLPSGSDLGKYFLIIDIKGTFEDNPVNLKGNGTTIMGEDEDFTLDVNDREYKIIYVDDDWRVV